MTTELEKFAGVTCATTTSVMLPLSILKMAPYTEKLVWCEVWIQGSDGSYYRPKDGWSLDYAYGRT